MKNRSKVAVLLSSSMCRILLTMLTMFFFIELAAPPLEAEAREEKGFINFPLEVDVDASGNKRWIFLPLADESQVLVDDDEARTIIFSAVNDLFTGRVSPEVQKKGKMRFGVLFSMFGVSLHKETKKKNLEMSILKVKTSPFDTVDGSFEIGAKETFKAPIKITIKGIPMQSLNLVLMIGDEDGEFDSTTIGTLGELTTDLISEPLDLKEPEANTVVSVSNSISLTESEINQLKPQLVRIAIEVFNHAKADGMVFGATPPAFGKEDLDLDKRFKFPDSKNVTLFMKESDHPEFTHELTFGVLKAVRKIDIQHPNKKYIDMADKLLKEIRKTLPRIWTAEFYLELEERLSDDRRIRSLGKTSIKDGVYLIEPDLGGKMFDGGAKASAGLTYSTEKRLAGTASATVSNLGGRNEQTSVGAELGDETRKANFDFSLPYPPYRSYNGRLKDSTFFLKAAYDRDKDQHYELVKADQELIKMGIGYKFVWNNLDSKQQGTWGQITVSDRKKSRFVTSGKLTFDYEDWHFRRQDPGAPSLNDGQYGIVKLNLAEDMTFDFRHRQSRFQELNVPVLLEGHYGFDINDDNDDFSQLTFAVQSKLYMRWRTEKDININLRFRGGISDDKTPVFKKFKVGNRDTIRGLESGEILADSYSLQSIEMGVSLGSLLKPLFGVNDQKDDNAQAQKENSRQEQIARQLEMVKLEIFYDRGSVSQDDSFSEMFKFDGDLEGYGMNFSIEVPFQETTAELEIGYAYSPDSETHSSGLFYTRFDSYIW